MSGIKASEVLAKISSVRTDFEMDDAAAVHVGINELEVMFVQFCSEIDLILGGISGTLTEMMEEIDRG